MASQEQEEPTTELHLYGEKSEVSGDVDAMSAFFAAEEMCRVKSESDDDGFGGDGESTGRDGLLGRLSAVVNFFK